MESGPDPVQMSVLHLCVLVSMYLVGVGVGTERCFLLLGEKYYVPNYQIKFAVRLKTVFLILDFLVLWSCFA